METLDDNEILYVCSSLPKNLGKRGANTAPIIYEKSHENIYTPISEEEHPEFSFGDLWEEDCAKLLEPMNKRVSLGFSWILDM